MSPLDAAITDAALAAARLVFDDKPAGPKTFDAMCAWMAEWLLRKGRRFRVTWSGTPKTGLVINFCLVEAVHEIQVVATVELPP